MEEIYTDAVALGALPDASAHQELWQRWLWGTDCNMEIEEELGDMNTAHLECLLLCVLESVNASPSIRVKEKLPRSPLVHLFDKPVAEYTLREVVDQMECLQLSWGEVVSNADVQDLESVLRALMARIGVIAHHAYAQTSPILDDPQYMTPLPVGDGTQMNIMSRKCIRQLCCMFFALFR